MDHTDTLDKIDTALDTINQMMNEMRIERTDVMDELVDYCHGDNREYLIERKDELDTYITASLNVMKALRQKQSRLRD